MSDIMVNSLGAVTFRDNIKLSVKTCKLLQILRPEYAEKLVLDLGNFPFV